MLGKVYGDAGFPDNAIIRYQDAIKLEPNSAADWSELGELYSRANRHDDAFTANLQAATLYEEQVRAQKALPPESLEKTLFGSTTLSFLGKAYQNTAQRAKAKQAYLQSIELDNGNTAAWKGLGDLAAESGDEREAIAAYRHARRDDNSEAAAWELLSFYYSDKKRDNDAGRCWLNAASLRNANR
jgi:cytochrome c-type biogenesis protein CcmH/NrfG